MPRTAKTPRVDAAAIRAFVEKELQPAIREDGGELRFLKLDGRTVHVEFGAACATCPSRAKTLNRFVTVRLRERFGDDLAVQATVRKPYFTA